MYLIDPKTILFILVLFIVHQVARAILSILLGFIEAIINITMIILNSSEESD
jgi:hypothetical protein